MNIIDLHEIHDGIDFSEVSPIWDEELLFKLENDLNSNFSKGRLDFFEKVAKIFRKGQESITTCNIRMVELQYTNGFIAIHILFRAILVYVIFIIHHRRRTFIASLHLLNEGRKANSCTLMKFVISARIINFAISFNEKSIS